jgi:hypothetical protein
MSSVTGLPVSMKRPKTDPPFHPDVAKDDPDFADYPEPELETAEFEEQHEPTAVPSTSSGIKLTGTNAIKRFTAVIY